MRGVVAVLCFVIGAGAVLTAGACSATRDQTIVDPDDPFSDPFFREDDFGSASLDEYLKEPAPKVGRLSGGPEDEHERQAAEREALERAGIERDPKLGESGPEDSDQTLDSIKPKRERTFQEKAEEATLATMSVLVGIGMAALPYLIGGGV